MSKMLSFFRKIKISYILLLFIVLMGLFARLYKIDAPIADWHSWRQVDTAAVTRNFIKEGFNPLYPRADDMSGIAQKPLPNLMRLRFVEFPIYNMVVYPFYYFLGSEDKYHRIVSAMFSLGSLILVYFITKRFFDTKTALLAALIFALLPYNVFFSRTTLPEPTYIFFALGMFYFVERWITDGGRWLLVLGYIFAVSAFLIKPWSLFFALPLIYSIYKKEGHLFPIKTKYIAFGLLALLPFLMWRLWIMQYPEGIPASSWLFNGDNIRFKPIFWWWIISERLGREILGVTGLVLFFVGLLIKPDKNNYVLHFLTISVFTFFVVVATGNVRHDYYQIIFPPVGAIFMARGFMVMITGVPSLIPRLWTILLALLFLPLTFYFTWNQVKGFYQINNPAIVEAGKFADKVLPEDAQVIAPYNGDTAFLYQIHRPGWPVTAFPVKELIYNYGATHFVSTAKDAKTKWVMRHFEVIEDNSNFVIVNLTKIVVPFSETDREP